MRRRVTSSWTGRAHDRDHHRHHRPQERQPRPARSRPGDQLRVRLARLARHPGRAAPRRGPAGGYPTSARGERGRGAAGTCARPDRRSSPGGHRSGSSGRRPRRAGRVPIRPAPASPAGGGRHRASGRRK
jgi:hypothetical protein